MKLFILIGFLLPMQVYGVSQEDLLHITAHAGATYVITHGTEVLCTKVIGKENKLTCTLTGIVLANAINIGRKAAQGFPSDTTRATMSGVAGSAAAAFIITIDF